MHIYYGVNVIVARVSLLFILICSNAYAVDTAELSTLAKSITERVQNYQNQFPAQSSHINETQRQLLNVQHKPKFFIAVSFSMPENLILDYLEQASKFDAWVVVQGFKDDTMPMMMRTLSEWDKKVDISRLLIDPNVFNQYQITQVPSLVLTTDTYPCDNQKCTATNFDKISGGVRIEHALKVMSERGDLHEIAESWDKGL